MTIGIDISQIVYQGTGVARYTRMLVESLIRYDKKNKYVFFFSSLRQGLDSSLEEEITKHHILKKYPFPPALLDVLWNRLHKLIINRLMIRYDSDHLDVFISSDWTQPPVAPPTKSVTIVHDLVYLRHPETLHPKIVAVQKRRMLWVKREVDHIIADSHSTKNDLVELLGVEKERISVVYPAVEVKEPTKEDIERVFSRYEIRDTRLPKPKRGDGGQARYGLTVGKLEPRKNIPRLISAFQKAKLKDTELLIVGPEGWDSKSLHVTRYTLHDNVRFLGFVPDSDLCALYKRALFFIYPSLYEGFGYPVVEAMSLGCPVATSNTSSLKEIAEGHGLLFDPESEEEIANAIVKLSDNAKLRRELGKEGKKRAKDFSSKAFAQNLLRVLQTV